MSFLRSLPIPGDGDRTLKLVAECPIVGRVNMIRGRGAFGVPFGVLALETVFFEYDGSTDERNGVLVET